MVLKETVLRDILDIVDDLKNNDPVEMIVKKNDRNYMKSISSKSRDLTLVFPVICSTHLPIETASIIAKAIERQAASMLQIVLAACSVSSADNAYEYISNFHTNLDTGSMTMDKFLDTLDKLIDENTIIPVDENFYKIKDELKRIAYPFDGFEDSISESGLDRFEIQNISEQIMVFEAKNPQIYDTADKISKIQKNNQEYFNKQLISSDVKKANELQPTMMTVQYRRLNSEGEADLLATTFLIGVKAKIYPVGSEDILNRIKIKHSDRNIALNLIKAGTKEIKFFKDFIFAIDKAKLDAVAQSNRGTSSKLWKILERRATKSKYRRYSFSKNDATAITSLVISQEEVDYLVKTSGINVEDPRVIREILEAYNLMGFVIADDVTEIASFIFDTGDDMYEKITYDNLQKDSGDNTKKILNLMNKTSR